MAFACASYAMLSAALLASGAAGPSGVHARPPSERAAESLLRRASQLLYDLDHDRALDVARQAVAAAPDNPAAHRTAASVILLKILFIRGAVTADHYLGSVTRSNVPLDKPPPDLAAEFHRHVARAIELAERWVAASPGDPHARYALGAAVGLQASYTATVEGRLLAGFKTARRAYAEHEKVLALDSSHTDAALIVGMYRYMVSTLALPKRLMAYVAGFGGGRERGISLLEHTAAAGRDARIDAMFALVLVYNREERYDDALRILQNLQRLHPANRLVLLEAGATALRAGRTGEADTLLTAGLAMLPGAPARRFPGEEALWRYKRGAARAGLGQPDAALADLHHATSAAAPAWIHGRAHVEIGRVALQRGDRAAAAGAARQAQVLCERGNDAICVTDATRLLRTASRAEREPVRHLPGQGR